MQVLIAPQVSEKSTFDRREEQPVHLPRHARRHQAGDQGGGRLMFRSRRGRACRPQREGQGEALRAVSSAAPDWKKGFS